MNVIIRNKNSGKTAASRFPCDEKSVQILCDALELPNLANTEIEVYKVVNGGVANEILQGKTFKIDELNYLFSRLDSFGDDEINTFYAVAYAEKLAAPKDFINLTFNTKCYNLLGSFENLNQVGKDLYMNECGGVGADEYKTLDGQKYVEDMVAKNPNPKLTPLGFVYPNKNEPQELYFGKTFPLYLNGFKIFCVELRTDDGVEYLDLPCEDSAVQKVLERLEITSLNDASSNIVFQELPGRIGNIVQEIGNDVEQLNSLAQALEQVGKSQLNCLEQVVEFTRSTTVQELEILCQSVNEFGLYLDIFNAEEYGRHIICESGQYTYDLKLDEYLDFQACGEQQIAKEVGIFTNQGYITYMGYNPAMIEILNENLGMNIQSQDYSETLRLYMPLQITTYEQENDYGRYEIADFEEELDSCELCGFENELTDFITSYGDHLPEQRGLMEYYGVKDMVNAKVESFKFEFEQQNGDVYGVAVCQLKAPLERQEMATLKDYITGQASDGFGEGLEQQDFKLDGRNVNISLWDSDRHFLRTADEMGFSEQGQDFEMSMN